MNSQEKNLLQQIGRTGRAMHAAFEAEVGMALPRWRILQALYERGGSAQKDLARWLSMDPASLTRQMKQMESEGIVKRRISPDDNRVTLVELAQKGKEIFEAAQPLRVAFSLRALEGLSRDRLDAAMAVLEALEERFRAAGSASRDRPSSG